LLFVPRGKCRRLAVTVGTKHDEVLEAMIFAQSVAVVELHGKRSASPLRESALITFVSQNTGL
jgi:hypothetical protein